MDSVIMDALLPFLVPVEFLLISMVRYAYNRLRQNRHLFSTDKFPVDTVDNAGNNGAAVVFDIN